LEEAFGSRKLDRGGFSLEEGFLGSEDVYA
jgi:hypothetical protein